MALTESFGQSSFFQVPPDSTGKKLTAARHVHLEYSGGTVDIMVDDIISDPTSGAEGVVVELKSSNSTATGEIIVVYSRDSYQDFTIGNSLQVNGGTVATISDVETFHTQSNNIVGANDPHNAQFIDSSGSAYIRFSEGEQQLDAFGLSRMTTPTLIGEYTFFYDKDEDHFQELISGASGATNIIDHLPNESSVRITTGTAIDDRVSLTTNRYHLYQPGFSQIVMLTVTCGDTGATDVHRKWGYFDENDGLFFEIEDNILYVSQRSSTSGSPITTKVAQSDWNGDVADGSGTLRNLSRFNLDISKDNVYWLDLEWLGAGRTRFGVFDGDGNRITLHTFKNANNFAGPYMGTANLPVRVEQYNTGVVGVPHYIKFTCASVMTEGNLVPDRKKKTIKRNIDVNAKSIPNSETPLLSFRASVSINSITNRKAIIPELISFFVETEPVIIRLYKNGDLTGDSWVINGDYGADHDISSSAYSIGASGRSMISSYYAPGSYNTSFPDNFGIQGEHLILNADGSLGSTLTVTAESLSIGNASVRCSVSYIEVG